MSWRTVLNWRWEIALAGCIAIALGILIVSESGHSRLSTGYDFATQSMRASTHLSEVLARISDAESGQRGYLLTRRDEYLQPYNDAMARVPVLLNDLRLHYAGQDDPQGLELLDSLTESANTRLARLEMTLAIARSGRTFAAAGAVAGGGGLKAMVDVRNRVADLQRHEHEKAVGLVREWRSSLDVSRFGIVAITALNIVLLVLMFRWMKRDWLHAQEREKELDRLVAERTEQLVALASHLQEMSEAEKTRLGRELHDELGSILTASKMDIAWVRGRLAPEQSPLGEKLERALHNLDQGIQAKRRIIENLRPTTLASFGLTTAARDLVAQAAEQAGWKLELDLPDHDPELPDEVEIALFRILQEALTNAMKYAQATRVRVSLVCESSKGGLCRLEIEDDGRGFRVREVRTRAHGLLGMRQRLESRGGTLEIRSTPGHGTTVRAVLPVLWEPQPTTVDSVVREIMAAGENARPPAAGSGPDGARTPGTC